MGFLGWRINSGGKMYYFVRLNREYDLPFDMCVCFDQQQFFFGQFHTVLGRNPSTKLPSICRKEALVEASEPVFYAFDIETPKAPLNSSIVEAVELGVFQLNLGALAQIVDGVLLPTMEHDELRNEAKIADIGAGMADFDAVSVQIDAVLLQALIERPLRTELPGICHLSDVGAMFPNIILTNLIEEVCMACIHNVPEAKCKCPLQWVWRGEIEFCRNAFKRLHGTEEVQKKRRMTTTICHREKPSLYVDNDEPTFRYKYKQMRKICIIHNQPLPMEEKRAVAEKRAATDLNSGKTGLIKLMVDHSDEHSLKFHFKSLSNFLTLNGVAVSPPVDDLSSVPTFKNAVAQMTEQLPVELKEHTGIFLQYFIQSLTIAQKKYTFWSEVISGWKVFTATNSHEEFFTRPGQSADVCEYMGAFFARPGQPAADGREHLDGQLRSAKIKLFNYAYIFGRGALHVHIETLWKCFGKGETVKRCSDGLQGDSLMTYPSFMNSFEQLLIDKCTSEKKADSFANFVDSFVDSLIDQSRLFNSVSVSLPVAGNEGLLIGQSSSNSSVFGAQQKASSVGPSSISSVVGEQQQQKDSSERAKPTDQCEHSPKKCKGGNN
ncbi:hypothetical protein niasHT_038511 [Heterodera trifolii]|uniref:DNA polymerase epsilon catalytic subunit n=1 Tax=Heterodera trifolii TaxID=157864 RepID=A0ABD2IXA6_9BILA